MKFFVGLRTALFAVLSSVAFASQAMAGEGQPSDWGLGLQKPVTAIAEEINWFHDLLLWIITIITIFVLALLVWVVLKYNEKSNPNPSKTTHNTFLEFAWTVVPVLILGFIAIFSFRVLYNQYDFPKADVVVKTIGNQWYWDYEYPDENISFASNMVTDEDVIRKAIGNEAFEQKYGATEGLERAKVLKAASQGLWEKQGMVRLLSTDTDMVVPVNKVVHVLIQANDVMHNWTVPSFGVKMDAVPGRTTAVWFKAEKTGTFYGQCSELCGIRHAFMPITVQVVSEEMYKKWLDAQKSNNTARIEQMRDTIRAANLKDRQKTFASYQ